MPDGGNGARNIQIVMQIIPTILEKDFNKAKDNLGLLKDLTSWIQIDVVDGVFAEGKSFELELLTSPELNVDDFLFDIHLMVKEPIKWIEKCLFANANRVIGQVEMMSDREEFVDKAVETGMEVGLAFDIETEVEDIPMETDIVLLLGRKAGFGDFKFEPKVLEKVKFLRDLKEKKGMKFKIAIDGGINFENILSIKKAGVEIAYCGKAVFDGNVKENLEKLKNI